MITTILAGSHASDFSDCAEFLDFGGYSADIRGWVPSAGIAFHHKEAGMARRQFAWVFLGLLSCLSVTGCCVSRPGGPVDPCSRDHEGGSCGRCGPFGGGLNRLLSCGSDCGEVYWDEWLSDPPDCCDPCVGGQYVGPRACPPKRPLAGLFGFLHGCRGEQCCDDECDNCDGAGCATCQPNQMGVAAPSPPPSFSDAPADDLPKVPRKGTPDPKAERPIQPYHPQYTRPASYYGKR